MLVVLIFLTGLGVRLADANEVIAVRVSPEEIRHPLKVFNEDGEPCGIGQYIQTVVQDGLVKVELRINLPEERTVRQVVEMKQNGFLQPVRFVQEHIFERTIRRYEMDFESGHAVCRNQKGSDISKEEAFLEFEEATTFAGVMLIAVALNFPEDESELDLNAVVFAPEPKVVRLRMSREHSENLSIGNSLLPAVKYLLSPVLPPFVDIFLGSSLDQAFWFSKSTHPRFLRFEGSIEPGGPLYRIDLKETQLADGSSSSKGVGSEGEGPGKLLSADLVKPRR
jgi:hypothetical protein